MRRCHCGYATREETWVSHQAHAQSVLKTVPSTWLEPPSLLDASSPEEMRGHLPPVLAETLESLVAVHQEDQVM